MSILLKLSIANAKKMFISQYNYVVMKLDKTTCMPFTISTKVTKTILSAIFHHQKEKRKIPLKYICYTTFYAKWVRFKIARTNSLHSARVQWIISYKNTRYYIHNSFTSHTRVITDLPTDTLHYTHRRQKEQIQRQQSHPIAFRSRTEPRSDKVKPTTQQQVTSKQEEHYHSNSSV